MEDWQIKELIDIACKGMNKLAQEDEALFGKLVDGLENYGENKTNLLETVERLASALDLYLYDHKPAVEE